MRLISKSKAWRGKKIERKKIFKKGKCEGIGRSTKRTTKEKRKVREKRVNYIHQRTCKDILEKGCVKGMVFRAKTRPMTYTLSIMAVIFYVLKNALLAKVEFISMQLSNYQ
jgi:hypothetical protein